MAVLQQGNPSDSLTEKPKRAQQEMAMAISGSPAKVQRVNAEDAGTSHRQQFLNLLQQQNQQLTSGRGQQ